MSAIWGAIAYGSAQAPDGTGNRMRRAYAECVIDRFGAYEQGPVLMGCGIQYVTPEAVHEALPVADETGAFTADIMLDNRAELLRELNLAGDPARIPDGRIAWELFRRRGADCLNAMRGAYAFVYYDAAARKTSLVLDATGHRCLYYRIHGGVLYFSSLLAPLIAAAGHDGVNGRWITDFLARDNFALMTEYEETAYAGIFRVAPRQIVTYDGERLEKRLYWDPYPELLKLKDDADCAAQLKEIYRDSIACLLRSEKPALLLSGGLDSTSIACYAARQLREDGRTLYTYTSVPSASYTPKLLPHQMEDERDCVLRTKAYLEAEGCRLSCAFLPLENVNGWDGRIAEQRAVETPYKSIQNMLWLAEGLRMAHASGSRILLNGGFGNVTISIGGIDTFLNALLEEKRFAEFLRQFRMLVASYGFGRKRALRMLAGTLRDYYRPRADLSDKALFNESFVREEALLTYDVRRRFAQEAEQMAAQRYREHQRILVHDLLFAQKGEVNTKHSLMTGVIPRDPTMDPRLIEFCMALPPGHAVRDGQTRRLVRVYMADDLPPHVLAPHRHGVQSPDVAARMAAHWPRIHTELTAIYTRGIDSPYVDSRRALQALASLRGSPEGASDFALHRLCYTAMVLEFIERAETAGAGM